jgi:GlcNAc-P-P-Und epimerase
MFRARGQDNPRGVVRSFRALVTGASGCIGRCLVKRLVAERWHVHLFDRNAVAQQRLLNLFPEGAVSAFHGNLASADDLRKACSGVDVVFHAAAKVHSVPRSPAEEEEFFAVNVSGTENLLHSLSDQILEAFVFFSTIAVYGTGDGSVLSETTAVHPETCYARSKLEAEDRVQEFFRNSAVGPTILRMALVYGEGERGNFSRMLRAVDKRRFLLVGNGATRKSMIYVEDVAAAALAAVRSSAAQGEVFLLSDPEAYRLRDIVETLARHLRVRSRKIRVPLWLARSGAGALETVGHWVGRRSPLTRDDVEKLVTDSVCDVSKIRARLGFQAQYGLEEGVRRSVEWYREEQTRQKGKR